jgi:hypothetical protein
MKGKARTPASAHSAAKTEHSRRQPARAALLFGLVTLVSFASVCAAAEGKAVRPAIKLCFLKGPWQMTLVGDTGCGMTTLLVNFTLNATGSGSATITGHSAGCGDQISTDLPFVIQTLNPNGSGSANLSCGPACGWQFNIQVNRSGTIFNVVDVDPANPGNFLEGTAIRQ